jgi:dihydrofolate synthase/folylpolyglutamate synthase
MNYQEALEYMEQVGKRGSILGLAPVKHLLCCVGNPQNQLKVIHVAGTNGKGSVCTFLEAMYQAEGKKVGRYISPTLHSYLERFQINGKEMEEEEFADILTGLLPFLQQMEEEGENIPTAFEIETVVTFLFFVRQQVDIVILETGMGGREDATNVVENPLCTVFTSIGMDHMQFLGDTVEKIALEKAGIMRDDCPVVSYPNTPEVLQVLTRQARFHHVNPLVVNREEIEILSEGLQGSTFRFQGEEYTIGLAGTYQIYNAATAIDCKLLLDGSLNKHSLQQVSWEGRFQMVSRTPLFIKDGAHNIDGAKALLESLQKHFTNRKIIFIIGVLRDKEYESMVSILCPLADCVYTMTPDSPRALDKEELRKAVLPYCDKVQCCVSVEEAVQQAKQSYEQYREKQEPAVIVAWGSLSYIGDIG